MTIELKLTFRLILLSFSFKLWQKSSRHLEKVKNLRCPEKFVGQHFIAESFEVANLPNQSVLTESLSVTQIAGVQNLLQIVAQRFVKRNVL